MYRGNDSVFRLSLTGIAFIFVFFLLVVLGWSHQDANLERDMAKAHLARRTDDPQTLRAFEEASRELRLQLADRGVSPEETVKKLTDKVRAERDAAESAEEIKNLRAQLNSLTDIKALLAKTGKSAGIADEALFSALELRARLKDKVLGANERSAESASGDEEILTQTLAALDFRRDLEARLSKKLGEQVVVAGQEAQWVQWLVNGANPAAVPSGAPAPQSVARAAPPPSLPSLPNSPPSSPPAERAPADAVSPVNALSAVEPGNAAAEVDLSALPTRFGQQGGGAAVPCWIDRWTNQVQFLLSIELNRRNVVVKRAWPATLHDVARAIPGINGLFARPLSYDAFYKLITPVAKHSGDQCQYAVRIKENMRSGVLSEKAYRQLEPLFYIVTD
ncbi:MAG: hypothetical protein LBI92_09185 [Azoarcus sp.]|jgi:hypothetical protein|nr:hypothetical protein [Azoarcus sp.]